MPQQDPSASPPEPHRVAAFNKRPSRPRARRPRAPVQPRAANSTRGALLLCSLGHQQPPEAQPPLARAQPRPRASLPCPEPPVRLHLLAGVAAAASNRRRRRPPKSRRMLPLPPSLSFFSASSPLLLISLSHPTPSLSVPGPPPPVADPAVAGEQQQPRGPLVPPPELPCSLTSASPPPRAQAPPPSRLRPRVSPTPPLAPRWRSLRRRPEDQRRPSCPPPRPFPTRAAVQIRRFPRPSPLPAAGVAPSPAASPASAASTRRRTEPCLARPLTAPRACSGFAVVVRIRSTTLVRLLHGLDLLPSGIPGAGTSNAMV